MLVRYHTYMHSPCGSINHLMTKKVGVQHRQIISLKGGQVQEPESQNSPPRGLRSEERGRPAMNDSKLCHSMSTTGFLSIAKGQRRRKRSRTEGEKRKRIRVRSRVRWTENKKKLTTRRLLIRRAGYWYIRAVAYTGFCLSPFACPFPLGTCFGAGTTCGWVNITQME